VELGWVQGQMDSISNWVMKALWLNNFKGLIITTLCGCHQTPGNVTKNFDFPFLRELGDPKQSTIPDPDITLTSL